MLRSLAAVVGIAAVLFSAYTLKEQYAPKSKLAEAGHGDHGGGGHGAEAGKGSAAGKDDHAGHDHGPKKEKPAGDDHKGHDHGPAKAGGKDDHAGHAHGEEGGKTPEGVVAMSAAQIEKARIDTAPAMNGNLAKEVIVTGRVALNGDRQARIVPKLPGTVSKIMKNVGQTVTAGEVLAVIESRDIADAKAEYLGAWRAEELAKSVYEREQRLWKQKVTAEQEYITAKNTHQSAAIKLDLAQQKLRSIGFGDKDIEGLKKAKADGELREYIVRSPLSGVVTNRNVSPGQLLGTDREIFTVADLSTVWVEIALAPADLPFAHINQEVGVTGGALRATGKVVVLSPVIDPDTRAAKAVVELDNKDGRWKLGDFVSAELLTGKIEAALVLPREAIQTIKGNRVVFVAHDKGFQMKPIAVGREDSRNVEVISGVEFGESVAISNTFVLKAELGKAEAEHEH